MAKVNEIVYSIMEQLTGFTPSKDTRIPEEFIIHQMNNIRAVLIKEKFDQDKTISDSNYQLICCLEVKCDRIICNGVDSGDKIYYVEFPKLMEGLENTSIKFVGTVEFGGNDPIRSHFDRYGFNAWTFSHKLPYVGKRPSYTIVGGYQAGDTKIDKTIALLKNLPTAGLRSLCALILLDNPLEGSCNSDETMNMEYPIPSHMRYKLEMLVLQQILSTMNTPSDDINNSKDDTANSHIQQVSDGE